QHVQQSWLRMIVLSRAAAIVFVLTAFTLTLVPQTADMLADAFSGWTTGSIWAGIAFHLSLFVLCFCLWYWPRAALSAYFAIADNPAARHLAGTQRDSGGDTVDLFAFENLPRWLF